MLSAEAMARKKLIATVRELDQHISSRFDEQALDGLVHDCFSEQATEVNNSGRPAQLECLLLHGWSPAGIIQDLRRQKEEDSEGDDSSPSCDCQDVEHGFVSNECAIHNLTPAEPPETEDP